MLEVGRVVDPRGEHRDHGVVAVGAQRGEDASQPFRVGVDGQDALVREELAEHALGGRPVLEHVGHTGWHPQVVLEHVHRAVRVADQVAAADVGPDVVRRPNPHALGAEVPRAEHDLGGHQPGIEDALLAVDIGDEVVQRGQPLQQPGLDPVPLAAGDDARDHVEGPRTVDADAVAVDGEGHPGGVDLDAGRSLAVGEPLGAELLERGDDRRGSRPGDAVGVDQLVVEPRS